MSAKSLLTICVAAISALGLHLMASAEDAYIASTTDTTKHYWIDTGYHAGPNTRVDADFEFLTRTIDQGKTYQQFVFEYGYESTCRIYINGSEGTGAIAWNCSSEGLWASTGVTMVPGVRYQMRIDPYENIVTLDADGDLTVEWVKGGAVDTYMVTPVYSVYGVETDGTPISVTVNNIPLGMLMLIR